VEPAIKLAKNDAFGDETNGRVAELNNDTADGNATEETIGKRPGRIVDALRAIRQFGIAAQRHVRDSGLVTVPTNALKKARNDRKSAEELQEDNKAEREGLKRKIDHLDEKIQIYEDRLKRDDNRNIVENKSDKQIALERDKLGQIEKLNEVENNIQQQDKTIKSLKKLVEKSESDLDAGKITQSRALRIIAAMTVNSLQDLLHARELAVNNLEHSVTIMGRQVSPKPRKPQQTQSAAIVPTPQDLSQ